jgi:tetratricopeptide (TPR) repeat protein
MSEVAQYRERLRNAIRQPVAALSAVEVDSVARAHDLVADLRPAALDRPSGTIEFDARATHPGVLLEDARKTARGWTPERGVLFVVDRTAAGETEPTEFWRGMNALRESWDAISAHVVFFLLPLNYRLLVSVADHLADWIPLRFHLLAPDGVASFTHFAPNYAAGLGLLSPPVARQQLEQLEPALAKALAEGVAPAVLVRRYYLPMFQAAVSTQDLRRASALFEQISEQDVAEADRPAWWMASSQFYVERCDYARSAQTATHLLEHARRSKDVRAESAAIHQLAAIAHRKGDFAVAERNYLQALALATECGERQIQGAVFHQLGVLAIERHVPATAEQWLRKALTVHEELGDDQGMALSFHQLGVLAQEGRDFAEAEGWFNRALETFTRLHADYCAAATRHHLGVVAQKKRDWDTAERLYGESLATMERLGDMHGIAMELAQLAVLDGLQRRFREAAARLAHSTQLFLSRDESHEASRNTRNFAVLLQVADNASKAMMESIWRQAGLGELPKLQPES